MKRVWLAKNGIAYSMSRTATFELEMGTWRGAAVGAGAGAAIFTGFSSFILSPS